MLLLFDTSDLCLKFWLLKLFCKVIERSVSGSLRENVFQFWLLIPGFVCFTDFDFFSVFCIIFVTLDSFLSQLVIRILLLLPLWQHLMTFRSMIVFLFYRCVICVKHLNHLNQETEECKMWPKFICTFFRFATKFQQILS